MAIGDFIPQQADWPFHEANSGDYITVRVTSKTEGTTRRVQLALPENHFSTAFFDRMTISPAGLALDSLRMKESMLPPKPPRTTTLSIRPPLVVTMDDAPNRVANLFPGFTGTFPSSTPPYDGAVSFKEVREVTIPESQERDTVWTILITSRASNGSIVFRPRFFFSMKSGLIFYTGDLYGVFFVYTRTDVGARYRALAEKAINPKAGVPS